MIDAMRNDINEYQKNPADFEVASYSEMEKKKLIEYMSSFELFAVAGLIYDCVLGEQLGDENIGYTDGKYLWTSQDIYHIEKYNAAVTDEFLKIALGNN